MNLYLLGGIIGSAIVLIGVLVSVISIRFFRYSQINQRMQEFVVETGTTSRMYSNYRIDQEDLTGSIFNRTIVPFIKSIVKFFGRFAPKVANDELNRKLSIIGNPMGMQAMEFNGLQIVSFLSSLLLAIVVLLPARGNSRLSLLLAAALLLLGYLAPVGWLSSRVKNAQNEIRYGLPDALDMLSVCTFAGLGFDQSLQRVSEYWQTALGNEFRRVVQEMELGVSRADALRSLSNRLLISELSSFVAIIIQADNLGMRIADVLHGQAEQMRIIRQFRAKEVANQLPAKMMVPLALLILPALLAVIFAPMVPSLLALFGNL